MAIALGLQKRPKVVRFVEPSSEVVAVEDSEAACLLTNLVLQGQGNAETTTSMMSPPNVEDQIIVRRSSHRTLFEVLRLRFVAAPIKNGPRSNLEKVNFEVPHLRWRIVTLLMQIFDLEFGTSRVSNF